MTQARLAARPALILLLVASSVFADGIDDSARLPRQGNTAEALARIERHLAQPQDARARLLKGVILAEQKSPRKRSPSTGR